MQTVGQEPALMEAAAELGCVDLPRLDPAGLRRLLAPGKPAFLRASHPVRLLEHRGARSAAARLHPFHVSFASNLEELPARLGQELSRAAVSSYRLREALIAEIAHLVRLFSAFAEEPFPFVELSRGTAGPCLPSETRLALVCPLVAEGPPLAGAWVASKLPAGHFDADAIPDVHPGTALVVRLQPSGPTEDFGAQRAADYPGLVLSLASSRPKSALEAVESWPRIPGTGTADVLLVSMPFGPPDQPSLALSLLKSTLPPGMAHLLYFTLPFVRRIGHPLYTWISEFQPYMTALVGEWLFADALFPRGREAVRRYVQEVLRERTDHWLENEGNGPSFITLVPDDLIDEILQTRDLVPGFLDHCIEEILARQPRVVGLTSVFQQHAASLALARRLKERAPEIAIVLGGSNCEGPMGVATARKFPFLDAVVCGEGEIVFPQLVDRLLAGSDVDGLQGVYSSSSLSFNGRQVDAPSYRDLDALPYPDFSDFFRQYEELGLAATYKPNAMFETSRGCWWGEKQHCTFCGLNGTSMAYRSKSPERALAELKDLIGRHPGLFVNTADNILDKRYFTTLLPQLAKENLGIRLFYEVKANLRKEEIRQMRAAGVTAIQPGIESLNDEVLRIMRKGVSALQNVRLLKWCLELEVRPLWNLIWGFPGESPEEYARMVELLPLLHHLPPPSGMSPIFLERFSPNHFQSEALGFADVRPAPSYGHIYPFAEADLSDLAYFFSYSYQDRRDVVAYTLPLAEAIVRWREAHGESQLVMIDRGDHLIICDTRPLAACALSFVDGLAREIYLACDDITPVRHLSRTVAAGAPPEALEEALATLVERRLLLRQGDALLALAIPGSLGETSGAFSFESEERNHGKRQHRAAAQERPGHAEKAV